MNKRKIEILREVRGIRKKGSVLDISSNHNIYGRRIISAVRRRSGTRKAIFAQDVYGIILRSGDVVVLLDNSDIEYPMHIGTAMSVVSIYDHESNAVTFADKDGGHHTLYAHRVMKIYGATLK
jgi:hypothetical protein